MIQKGLDEKKMKIGIFDGNSAGKTYFGANLVHAVMCPAENRNPWFNYPFLTNWKWDKHLRLVCKATDLKEGGMVHTLIKDIWPAGDYETSKGGYDFISLYTHKATKFFMSVRTFDQPVEQHDDGGTISMLWVNEPPRTSVWKAYPPRFRKGGFMLVTATLVRESAFFKEDVMDNPSAVYSMGDMHENCEQHSRLEVTHPLTGKPVMLKGALDHDNLESIIRESPENEQEARRTGRPVHLSGAAFRITESVHFVPRSELPLPQDISCSILALDPHQRRPWAFGVYQKTHHGKYFKVDEWPRIDTNPWRKPYHKITDAGVGHEFYVKAIRDAKILWNIRDINCVIDSKFASQSVTTDQQAQKLREILAQKYRLYFQNGVTAVRGDNGGIDALKSLLAYNSQEPLSYENQPSFYICDDLWNSKYQIQNVTWDEAADPDKYGMKESLEEKYLDFPRIDMYAVMHRASHNRAIQNPKDLHRQTLDERWKKVSADFAPSPVQSSEDEGSSFASEVYYV